MNIVFILHFRVMGNFKKCISHDKLTKYWPFTKKCKHQNALTLFLGHFFVFVDINMNLIHAKDFCGKNGPYSLDFQKNIKSNK